MPSVKSLSGVLAAALFSIASPGVAIAQSSAMGDAHTFTLSLMGGVGASIDKDEAGYDNTALQLGFSVATEGNVEVAARVGTLGFGSTELLGNLREVDLLYATIASEYTFGEVGYQSGIFFGIGAYRLEGTRRFTREAVSSTRLGVTGGVTGEFDVTRRAAFLAELTVHLVPGAEAEVITTGLVGVGFYIK